MSKKNFKNNPVNNFITKLYDTQEINNTQNTYDTQEINNTQNIYDADELFNNNLEKIEKELECTAIIEKKRSQKHPRINMAFYGDNLDYLKVIGRISGMSSTEYVNQLIEKDKIEKADIIEKAKKILIF